MTTTTDPLDTIRDLSANIRHHEDEASRLRDERRASYVEARAAGHPLRVIAEAAGVSVPSIITQIKQATAES